MKYFKKLVGENVYLSPMNAEDAEQYVEWLNDFRVTDGLGGDIFTTLPKEKEWLEKSLKSEDRQFAIVGVDGDRLLGNCGFNFINARNRYAEIGLFVGDEENRGKGFGAEAIGLLLDYGFNYLNFHAIALSAYSFNARAIACYKKAGFKESGRRRQKDFVNGKYYDEILMDILSDEFEGGKIKNINLK